MKALHTHALRHHAHPHTEEWAYMAIAAKICIALLAALLLGFIFSHVPAGTDTMNIAPSVAAIFTA